MGTVGSRSVLLLRTGIGPSKTAVRLGEIKEPYPSCVLSIGCAGALDPDVRPGDVIVPEKIIDARGHHAYTPAPELVSTARNCCATLGLAFHSGSAVTTSEAATTEEEKKALAAGYEAVCVDMETAQVAAWAQPLGIPMLSIRTISDALGDRLPPQMTSILDAHGKLRLGRAVPVFLRQPALAVELFRLKAKFDHSIRVLAGLVTSLIPNL